MYINFIYNIKSNNLTNLLHDIRFANLSNPTISGINAPLQYQITIHCFIYNNN